MAKWLQVWQYGSQAERTFSAAMDTCQQYGFDGLVVKALDGRYWMGDGIDPYADALSSVDQIAQQTADAHARGLSFAAFVNVRQNAMDEGMIALHAQIAQACDGLAFDVEPYDGFLGAWPPVGLCRSFASGIREASAGATLIFQPDGRLNHLAEVRVEEWLPYVDVYCPQDYVNDFYTNPTADLERALLATAGQVASNYGVRQWTTAPGNADMAWLPSDAIGALEGMIVWRMGTTGPDALSYLGGIQMAQGPVDSCEAELEFQKLIVRDIADRAVQDRLTAALDLRTASGRRIAIDPRLRDAIQQTITEAQTERAQSQGPRESLADATILNRVVDGPVPYGNLAEGTDKP